MAGCPDVELQNPVPESEAAEWVAAMVTTFLGNPYDDDFTRRVERWRREWLPERTWGFHDGTRWIGTLATEPRTVTIPGRDGSTVDIESDAVTGVTVAATHRRRGLLTRMITPALQAAKDRDDPFSVLIAAEWPIYGRFGYAPATHAANYTYFPRHRNASVLPIDGGTVRQVPAGDLGPIAPELFDRARRRRQGQVDRRGLWWSKRLGLDGFETIGPQPHWMLHEGPDGPDGLLAWKVTRDFELDGALGAIEVEDFTATSDMAYQNLWAYLAGIDVVDEIAVREAAPDEPVRWLMRDGRALRQTFLGDDTWLRLLNVPAALSARGYASAGRLVLEVVDADLGGYAAGRYLLDGSADGASCASTRAPADLRLSQRALASAYLGTYSLRQLAPGGGVVELTSGAMSRFDAMFATPIRPWNATGF